MEANVSGWVDAPRYMYGATPLRRDLFVDWYQPVARIGRNRFDICPVVRTLGRKVWTSEG